MTIDPRRDGLDKYKRGIRGAPIHDEATIGGALDRMIRVLAS